MTRHYSDRIARLEGKKAQKRLDKQRRRRQRKNLGELGVALEQPQQQQRRRVNNRWT